MWETPSSSRRRAATVVVAGRFPSPGGIASRSSGPRRPIRTPGAISPGRHFPQARAASGTAGRALVAAPPSGDAAPGLQRQTSVLSALQGGGCGRGRAPPTKERQAAIGTRRPSQPGRRITSPRSQRSGSADYRPSASQVSTAPSWALTKGRRSGVPSRYLFGGEGGSFPALPVGVGGGCDFDRLAAVDAGQRPALRTRAAEPAWRPAFQAVTSSAAREVPLRHCLWGWVEGAISTASRRSMPARGRRSGARSVRRGVGAVFVEPGDDVGNLRHELTRSPAHVVRRAGQPHHGGVDPLELERVEELVRLG